jgi:hypothetical protein
VREDFVLVANLQAEDPVQKRLRAAAAAVRARGAEGECE